MKEKQNQNKNFFTVAAQNFAKAKRRVTETANEARDAFWLVFTGDFGSERTKPFEKAMPFLFVILCFFSSCLACLSPFGNEVFPAGFAILSAVGKNVGYPRNKAREKHFETFDVFFSLSVFAGALLSCVFMPSGGLIYFASFSVLFLLRCILSDGKFDESVVLRLVFASFSSAMAGLCVAFFDSFSVRNVVNAVSLALISPVIAYLLSFFRIKRRSEIPGPDGAAGSETGLFTVVFLVAHTLRNVRVIGFSPVFIACVVLVFAIAKKKGALYGAIAGAVTGMAIAGPVSVQVLTLTGFFAGIFFSHSLFLGFGVPFIISLGYSLYGGGIREFGITSSDYVAGMTLCILIMRYIPEKKAPKVISPEKAVRKETVREARKKLKSMSDAFSSISEVFYTVSDTMKKPQFTETTKLVSDVFSEKCSRCDASSVCWGREYSASADMTSSMATKLLSSGTVSEDDFDPNVFSRCGMKKEICDTVNKRFADLNGNFYRNNKTRLLAGEYSSISKLIKNTAGDMNRELEINPASEEKAKRALSRTGINYGKVAVFGTREMKIDVYGISMEKMDVTTDDVLSAFGDEFGFPFDAPDFLLLEDSAVMRLKRKRKFALECAKSGCMKKGEVVNGDSTSFFETDRDYFYTLICDGMGSGREAAFTSRLASIFIEKLMCCQSPKNLTFEMLNAFLMSKNDETFTTVDLFEIDLLSGEGNFIKAGAAPSFIIRNDRIHKIESRTLPYGIVDNICAEKTTVPLKDGDYIIMTSDGVEADTTGEWILKFMSECEYRSAGEVCEGILSEAKERSGTLDDISVSVVRVMSAK